MSKGDGELQNTSRQTPLFGACFHSSCENQVVNQILRQMNNINIKSVIRAVWARSGGEVRLHRGSQCPPAIR